MLKGLVMRKKIFCALFSIFIFTQSSIIGVPKSGPSISGKTAALCSDKSTKSFFSAKRLIFGVATIGGLFLMYKMCKFFREFYFAYWGVSIFLACQNNDDEALRGLAPRFSPKTVNRNVERGQTALFWACRHNKVEVVRALVPHYHRRFLNSYEPDEGTALRQAVINNNLEIVEMLIEHGAYIQENALDEARNKDVDRTAILNYLNEVLENDPTRRETVTKDSEGKIWKSRVVSTWYTDEEVTAVKLFSACEFDDHKQIKELQPKLNAKIVNFNYGFNHTALFWACKNNNTEGVKIILPHCNIVTINLCPEEEGTPLHQAVINNNLEIVEALVEHGSSIEEEVLQEARKKDVDRKAISNYLNRIVREEPDRLIKRTKFLRNEQK